MSQISLARKGKHHLPARANITCKANITQKTESSQRLLSVFCGAAGRTRTGTLLRAADFESATSANFVTAANCVYFIAFLRKICNNIRIGRLERLQICFPISKQEYNTINLTNNQGFFTKNYKLWIKLF